MVIAAENTTYATYSASLFRS